MDQQADLSGFKQPYKVNLCSGYDKYPGWIRVDAETRCHPDVLWDLRDLPLPFETGSVNLIYMEMGLSQLEAWQGRRLLQDCWRMLRPKGWMRIHEFDFDDIFRRYKRDDLDSPAGFTSCERLQWWLRRYGWNFVYDRETLRKFLKNAGFVNIREPHRCRSDVVELRKMDKRRQGFVMEGQKPHEISGNHNGLDG